MPLKLLMAPWCQLLNRNKNLVEVGFYIIVGFFFLF